MVESRKLDYELLDRWVKYMAKPTDKYKYKEAWQAMMKRALAATLPAAAAAADVAEAWERPQLLLQHPRRRPLRPRTPATAPATKAAPEAAPHREGSGGRTAPAPKAVAATPAPGGGGGGRRGGGGGGGGNAEVKKLADEFQENVVQVMLARKELNDENEVIIAKSLEGTKKKKRASKPNEFITNDDFCPNCGLRLKNLPEDENNFWTEIFQRELRDSEDPAAMMAMGGGRGGKPGVLLFRGWGLESRIG